MDLGLTGKVALLTAASRGLGRAVALELAAEGADVALCSRDPEQLTATAERVQAAGPGRVHSRSLDVRDSQELDSFFEEVTERLGPPDLLLVNAGGPPAGRFFEVDPDGFDEAFALTVRSAVNLCRLVLPGMQQLGFGRIVAITSVAARQPVENLALSNILRPSVLALVKELSVEAAASGVTVNAVAPGFHLTSAVERLITRKMENDGLTRQEVLAGWEREIPAGRLGRPEELAALVVFLMSERAGYLTGQCITSDGGWVRSTF
jgi:3-oxoacyl-[acyl-carrier protein] reductase